MFRSFALTCIAAITFLAGPAVLVQPAVAETAIPTPESMLGNRVGDDFFLATYDESLAYFKALAKASDRVELVRIGTTSGGLEWYIAVMSSPENLQNLDELRRIAQRLAHPEGIDGEEPLDDDTARALAKRGKAIVHIDNGLHSTEVAHAQHAIQLAYDLAVEQEDPEILRIFDEVVLLLWPSMNPDGQNMVVEWYRSNLGTPYEVAPLPRLYQKYVGHDNNRDGYMLNTHESRQTTRVIREWEPQILYNHHQTAPFPARIWIPPFAEPVSPHVHPLMWRTVNLFGMAMAQALEERGQEGAVHMGTGFDNWYPGFMDHANNFHNVASFLTETGLYRYATPHFYTVADFPKQRRNLRPESLYSSPWEGGWWRLRDAVDYMLTASISVLDTAAKYREDLLYNRYQAGRDVIELYRQHPPHAFVIPREQRDPVAAVELLRRLAFNGIAVHRTTQALELSGETFPADTWVIAMDQPFAHFVRQLFAVQTYPDLRQYPDGPPDQPYDVAGWTLPYQMELRVFEVEEPLTDATRRALEPVVGKALAWDDPTPDAAPFDSPLGTGFDTHPTAAGIVPPPGKITGQGSAIALDAAQNNSYRFLGEAWKQGATVGFEAGSEGRSGRFLVRGLKDADALARRLAIRAERTDARGKTLRQPRVGLYRPHQASIDEGWTRWLLERYGVAFENLGNGAIRAGHLKSKVDVMIVPDISPRGIRDGFTKGTVPPRYAGGLGAEGARAIEAFVRDGGTLVTFNNSSRWAIDALHLPVDDAVDTLPSTEFFLGGSLVELHVDPSHPVMTGMPERSKVFVARSPVFEPGDGFEGRVLARYPDTGTPLLSGYLLGEEHLHGHAAALEVEHGDGRVILLGLRPQWRAQPFGTFRLVFNAALYGAELAKLTPDYAGVDGSAKASDGE